MPLPEDLKGQLDELTRTHSLRSTRPLDGSERTRPLHHGQRLVAFCSNDYLGLASHPALAAAATTAVAAHGFGAGASRLVSGESSLHLDLEAELATFTGHEATLLFPTGYQANVGIITALASRDDLIASDAANHASIIDGCRLSRARVGIYRHADAADAARVLATPGPFRRRILVTESVFSMDGDRAPLLDLQRIAAASGAVWVVDEAHALGCAGPAGRGVCADLGVLPEATVGTLGKAFGTAGGFVATSAALRAVLVNTARTFIFTTAAPPPVVAASLAALRLVVSAQGDTLRRTARDRAPALRAATAAAGFPIPGRDLILPLVLGSNARALRVADRLSEAGLVVPAIRPPTVPEGTARLRITVSAAHTAAEINALVAALCRALGEP